MASVQLVVLILALLVFMVGIVSVALARCSTPHLVAWGRRLSFLVLLALGGNGVLAACYCAKGLSFLGIIAGLLVVAMLWDAPTTSQQESA